MGQVMMKIDRLTKRFGDFEAVSSLTLDVEEGEVFTLLGPNGAGKTTTIRMLMGILRPSSGTATVRGLDCFADRAEVKRTVGYLPDEAIFYDYLRGSEIIRFVGDMHGLSRKEALARSGAIVERMALLDDLGEYAANYSHGMKKKLALVCAMLHEPDLLILDEPTNGLDPYATREVHAIMREMVEAGRSVFFSTHLLDQAQKLSHRVGILYRGKLAAVGKLDELKENSSADATLEEIFFSVTGDAQASIQDNPPR